MLILDELGLEPEKLGAWLRFASYTRLERVRFCITLITCSQLSSAHLLLIVQVHIKQPTTFDKILAIKFSFTIESQINTIISINK